MSRSKGARELRAAVARAALGIECRTCGSGLGIPCRPVRRPRANPTHHLSRPHADRMTRAFLLGASFDGAEVYEVRPEPGERGLLGETAEEAAGGFAPPASIEDLIARMRAGAAEGAMVELSPEEAASVAAALGVVAEIRAEEDEAPEDEAPCAACGSRIEPCGHCPHCGAAR